VRNIALSNIDGLRNFYIYSAGNSSLHKIENSIPDRIEENEVRRYDTLNLPIPDLIVMDAQGHEHRILEGFGKGLRNTRYICFETSFKVPYENAGDFENIHKYLSKLGFRFVASNVSGIGIINFRIMKIRGMLFSLRRSKGKSLFFYQSFFDVLYERK
jgi:hypothetical protein